METLKIFKKVSRSRKKEKSHSAEKMERGAQLLCNCFVFRVGGFGCVQNQVLTVRVHMVHKKWTIQSEAVKKNKTGSSQVGAISKAQKYLRNNYWKHLQKFFFLQKNYF